MLTFQEDPYAGSKGREAKLRSMHSLEIGLIACVLITSSGRRDYSRT